MHGTLITPMMNGDFTRSMSEKLAAALEVAVQDIGWATRPEHYRELSRVAGDRYLVTTLLRELAVETPVNRYNIEYSTAVEIAALTGHKIPFKGTHYWFYSPVLDHMILSPLLREGAGFGTIADVGCGEGTLIRKIWQYGQIGASRTRYGFDISPKAVECIRGYANGYCGRIQDSGHDIQYGELERLFLSYFVDRDCDQRATFEASARLLQEKGRLILEGLFPCVLTDSNGVSYGKANVTRGEDAVEDIQLVVAELKRLGMTLHQVMVGTRLVYSLDGPEVLPTYILIFEKV